MRENAERRNIKPATTSEEVIWCRRSSPRFDRSCNSNLPALVGEGVAGGWRQAHRTARLADQYDLDDDPAQDRIAPADLLGEQDMHAADLSTLRRDFQHVVDLGRPQIIGLQPAHDKGGRLA